MIFCIPPEGSESKVGSGRPLTVKLKVKNKSLLLTSIGGPQKLLNKFARKATARSARNLSPQLIKLLNEPLTSDALGVNFGFLVFDYLD